MLIDLRQIDEAKTRFTELGRVISDLAKTSEDTFSSTLDALKDYSDTAQTALSSLNVTSLRDAAFAMQRQQALVAGLLTELPIKTSATIDSFNTTLTAANESFKDFTKFSEAAKQGALSAAAKKTLEKGTTEGKKKGDKDEACEEDEDKKKPTLLQMEAANLQKQGISAARSLKIPIPGAIAAGIIEMMIMGSKRKQRIDAEAAEVFNVYQSAFGSFSKGIIQQGTAMISKWQETLQQAKGIGREQIQGVVKAFTEGGLSVEEQNKAVGVSFKDLGDSLTLYSLAVDKMFELAGGQTAERMVGVMRDYGANVDQARESVVGIFMAGKESGIGAMQFAKNIFDAAASIKNYGININDIVDASVILQEHFQEFGVPKQFAGRLAAEGVKEIAGMVGGLSDTWKMIIGEKMGFGHGLEAWSKFNKKFQEVQNSKDKKLLFEYVKKLYDIVLEAAGGDEYRADYIASALFNLKQPGIEAFREIGKLKSYDSKTAAAVEKNLETLQGSFEDESTKTAKWQLQMNIWMQGVAKIGEGMLQLLATLVFSLAQFWSLLFRYLEPKDDADKQAAAQEIANLGTNMKKGWDKMQEGWNDMKKTMPDFIQELVGSALFPDSKDGGKGKATDKTGAGDRPLTVSASILPFSGFPDLISGGGQQLPPAPEAAEGQVRVVTVPVAVSQPGTHAVQAGSVYQNVGGTPTKLTEEAQKGWFGGHLAIVSTGVDQQGNIKVALVGNCPACGLVFGGEPSVKKADVSVDEKALSLKAPSTSGLMFPLESQPSAPYTKEDSEQYAKKTGKKAGSRYYGAKRKSGIKHRGVDLIKKPGTPVFAMAAGKVLRRIENFTSGVTKETGEPFQTNAVLIDDGEHIILYGEISTSLQRGDTVKQGQRIGTVMMQKENSMLHLEMYPSSAKSSLKPGDKPWQLYSRMKPSAIDPSEFLKGAAMGTAV